MPGDVFLYKNIAFEFITINQMYNETDDLTSMGRVLLLPEMSCYCREIPVSFALQLLNDISDVELLVLRAHQ